MRSVKELIQDQVDYTILQIVLDMLKQQKKVTEEEWQSATQQLKDKFNPPTRMLENYND